MSHNLFNPLQEFKDCASPRSLKRDGSESMDILGVEKAITPMQNVTMVVHRKSGLAERGPLMLSIDIPIEVDYYQHGGILPYVLRQLLAAA